MISFKAIDLLKSIPQNLKDLNVYTFSKNIKIYYSHSNIQSNLSPEIKHSSLDLSTVPLLYFTLLQLLLLTIIYVSDLFLFPHLYKM